ncbi:TPA: PapG chaperone-binding domain-containing protein [Photobacterium damselae]
MFKTKKILLLVAISNYIVCSNSSYAGNTNNFWNEYNWSFRDVAQPVVNVDVNQSGMTMSLPNPGLWAWGRPYLSYARCGGKEGITTRTVHQAGWVAYPESVNIAGKNATIRVTNAISTEKYGGYVWAKTNTSVKTLSTEAVCGTVGNQYSDDTYINVGSGSFRAEIDIPGNIPVGVYSIPIPMKAAMNSWGYSSAASANPLPISTIHASSTSNPKTTLLINIKNSCTYSTADINIDHGRIRMDRADGNRVKKIFSLNCTAPAKAKFSFSSLSTPNINTPSQYRAGLGHGWDSILYINGNSSSVTTNLTSGNNTIDIESELSETATAKEGLLNGTAVLNVEMV